MLLRGLIREQQHTNQLLERIATALEQHNAHLWPQVIQPNPELPAVEVTYASDVQMQELMQIELDLLSTTGRMPTEDEVQLEYDRRHTEERHS